MGAKSGKKKKPPAARAGRTAGFKRLTLIVFGAIFIVLVAGFAIAHGGFSGTSVPDGDAAVVSNVPDDISHVSEAEVKKAVVQTIAAQGLKTTPKPGSKKAEEVREAAFGELLQVIWIKGEAEEMGISVTEKQIATELAQIKKTNFPTPASFSEFLKTSGLSQEQVNEKVEVQLLLTKIQEAATANAPEPTASAIEESYEENKATQYTTKPSRDVRIIINENKAEVEAALKQLEADDAPQSWKKVAEKYSSDPTTKVKGGLQEGLTEELLQTAGPLKKAIFGAATGEVQGPVKFQKNYVVFEVEKLHAEKVQSLTEVKAQIQTTLKEELKNQYFEEFGNAFTAKWTARTTCASDFLVSQCGNYKAPAHSAEAPAACYEANPKAPTKKGEALECPAPVTQTKPAMPGTVTPLKPKGEQAPQRPRPEGLAEGGEEAVTLPEGATQTTGE